MSYITSTNQNDQNASNEQIEVSQGDNTNVESIDISSIQFHSDKFLIINHVSQIYSELYSIKDRRTIEIIVSGWIGGEKSFEELLNNPEQIKEEYYIGENLILTVCKLVKD